MAIGEWTKHNLDESPSTIDKAWRGRKRGARGFTGGRRVLRCIEDKNEALQVHKILTIRRLNIYTGEFSGIVRREFENKTVFWW